MGGLFATLRYDVCCVLGRVSRVTCLLPFQALAQAVEQNSTLMYLNLRNNNIGPEGAKAWCLVTMGSWGETEWRNCKKHSRVKVTLGKEVRQCNAALVPRCIYPIEICDDKWLGYLACIGQTLVQKKRIIHNTSWQSYFHKKFFLFVNSKPGHPVILKF